MVALIRPGWVGSSPPPYREWTFHKLKHRLGGPNFIRIPDGSLWAASRGYPRGTPVIGSRTREDPFTVLARKPSPAQTLRSISSKRGWPGAPSSDVAILFELNSEGAYQPVAKVVTAFDRPCIPADCVAPRSHMSNMLPQSALSGGRRNGLGARGTFATGCQAPNPISRARHKPVLQLRDSD